MHKEHMNTTTNTERPKLKLNFGAKPLTLVTNSNSAVATDPSPKKVVVFAKPKADDLASTQVDKVGSKASASETMSDVATDVVKVKM